MEWIQYFSFLGFENRPLHLLHADILNGNNIYDLIYDQTKMREHLIACFEQRKITTFPLYEKRNTEKVVTYKETSSPWNKPRRSARLRSKATQNFTNKIKLSNRFKTKEGGLQKKDLNKSIELTSKAVRNKMKTTGTICNISSTKLSESEISLPNKGLNSSKTNLTKNNFWTIYTSFIES